LYKEYSHGHSNVASFSGSSKFGILNVEGRINKKMKRRGGGRRKIGVSRRFSPSGFGKRRRKGIAVEIAGVL
jgi:hypothetical protein